MSQNDIHDPDCIFCKIAKGEIPSEKLYDDGEVFVIKDINPLTPVHLLVIPYGHIPTLMDLPQESADLVGKVFMIAKQMAAEQGIAEKGFRVMLNVGQWGAQVIDHVHFHIFGGADLRGFLKNE